MGEKRTDDAIKFVGSRSRQDIERATAYLRTLTEYDDIEVLDLRMHEIG